ncbi:MAG: CHAP domain-containing protein [Candidatus Hadarchaeales archaeon]
MRILVTPEHLSELAGQFQQVSGGLLDVGHRCQGALASLDWEVRQKAEVESEVQAAVRQAYALAEQAEALARFLQDAAHRFAEADRQELTLAGGAVLGASTPPPFWRLPEGKPGGLPFIPVPRVVVLATGTMVGSLTALLPWAFSVPANWSERVWNWLHGRGWRTNAELASLPSKGELYDTIMRGFERARKSESTRPPIDNRPLTAERDAAHPLRPADPGQYDQRVGCVQYAINRRPDLRVTDAPIPGAADYIPYYEKKGQVLRLQGTEADLRQWVKPGHAVVWPRQHEDLKGTAGWNYGHVAIVEEVYPDHVVVSQAGWPGKSRMEIRKDEMASLVVIL